MNPPWIESVRKGPTMDFVAAFNLIEAIWWTALAVLCGSKARGVWTGVARTAAVILLLFAATELIEFQTGAWWQPWWLAVVKGLCVAGLVGCGLWAWRIKRKFSDAS